MTVVLENKERIVPLYWSKEDILGPRGLCRNRGHHLEEKGLHLTFLLGRTYFECLPIYGECFVTYMYYSVLIEGSKMSLCKALTGSKSFLP